MRVAVVDDKEEMLEVIHSYITNNSNGIVCKCHCFQKPQALLDRIRNGCQYDLYFLDIKMPEINGLELARKIRGSHRGAYIVFVTHYAEYALAGYDARIKAYHYIMKNQMQEKIPEVLKAVSLELQENREQYYVIQNKLRYERFRISGIKYIYKEGKNTVFVTEEGTYKERNSLKNVMKILNNPGFIYIDPGRVVHIKYIRKIEGGSIRLTDGTWFYLSQANLRKVKKEITEIFD